LIVIFVFSRVTVVLILPFGEGAFGREVSDDEIFNRQTYPVTVLTRYLEQDK